MATTVDEYGNIVDDSIWNTYTGPNEEYDVSPASTESGVYDAYELKKFAERVADNKVTPDEAKTFGDSLTGAAKKLFEKYIYNPTTKEINFAGVGTALGAISALTGGDKIQPAGYAKPIPNVTATRAQVPYAADSNRRPGESGRQYFTPMAYSAPADAAATQTAANKQAQGIAALVPARAAQVNPYAGTFKTPWNEPKLMATGGLAGGGFVIPADVISGLGNGSSEAGLDLAEKYLGAERIKGDGDGMSDSIPTHIDGKEKALVANDEAYISPEKVKALGGSEKLFAMMDKVRKARTGTKEQGKKINAEKFMPGGIAQLAGGGKIKRFVNDATVPPAGTSTSSSLSPWAGDYVTNMLGKAQGVANAPYEAYGGPLTAGASDLQNQAFAGASSLAQAGYTPKQFDNQYQATGAGTATQFTNQYQAPVELGGPATQFTNQYKAPGTGGPATQFSTEYNAPGAGEATQFTSQYKAPGTGAPTTQFTNQFQMPQAYNAAEFTTGKFGNQEAQQYMNPYLQQALDPQIAEARRQYGITQAGEAGKMTKSGAFGGSRQAILEAEGQRNLGTNLADITGKGYNTAYQQGMAQFSADQARQLQAQQGTEQSRQFGAGQGLAAAQASAQYGQSAQAAQEQARQYNLSQEAQQAQYGAQYGQAAQAAQEQARQFGIGQLASQAQAGAQYRQAGQTAQEQARQFGIGQEAQQAQYGAQYGQAAQQAQEQARQFGLGQLLSSAQTGAQYGQAAQAAQEQARQFGVGQEASQAQLAAQYGQSAAEATEASRRASSEFGLKSLGELERLGATQRGITSEGIAADKAEFEAQRDYPAAMAKFQRDMITGLPLTTQQTTANTTQLQDYNNQIAGLSSLYERFKGLLPSA